MRTLLLLCLCWSSLSGLAEEAWPLLPDTATDTAMNGHYSSLTGPQRLLWGVFTFHYLNEDYQAAFNQLALIRQQIPDSGTTADVLETTVLLALGLTHQARQRYLHWQQQGINAPARSWFYLARRWYEAGYYNETTEAITQALSVTPALPENYRQEALFLAAASQIELDQDVSAARIIALMERGNLWLGLARHNLLLNKILQHAPIHEIERLVRDSIYDLPASPEGEALRDKILLLAGLHALEGQRFREAERFLQGASLNTAYSAPALLQYGWARFGQQKYQQALQPWRILQQQFESWHPVVLESVLGVPRTLELLQANTQALKGYQRVDALLQQMLDELQGLQQDEVIRVWLQSWSSAARRSDQWAEDAMGRSLSALLMQPGFNTQLQQLADLHHLQQDLSRQQQRLNLWLPMVKQRQRQFAEADIAQRLQDLQRRQQLADQQLTRLQQRWQSEERGWFAFASKTEQRQVGQLEQVVDHIRYLQNSGSAGAAATQSYKERWRRVRGVLLWSVQEQQPQRRWQAQQGLWQLQQELSRLQDQLHSSRQALSWTEQHRDDLAPIIIRQQQATTHHLQQLAALQHQQQRQLEQQIRVHLQQLYAQLLHYQGQARLAAARLQDDALQRQITAAAMPAPAEGVR